MTSQEGSSVSPSNGELLNVLQTETLEKSKGKVTLWSDLFKADRLYIDHRLASDAASRLDSIIDFSHMQGRVVSSDPVINAQRVIFYKNFNKKVFSILESEISTQTLFKIGQLIKLLASNIPEAKVVVLSDKFIRDHGIPILHSDSVELIRTLEEIYFLLGYSKKVSLEESKITDWSPLTKFIFAHAKRKSVTQTIPSLTAEDYSQIKKLAKLNTSTELSGLGTIICMIQYILQHKEGAFYSLLENPPEALASKVTSVFQYKRNISELKGIHLLYEWMIVSSRFEIESIMPNFAETMRAQSKLLDQYRSGKIDVKPLVDLEQEVLRKFNPCIRVINRRLKELHSLRKENPNDFTLKDEKTRTVKPKFVSHSEYLRILERNRRDSLSRLDFTLPLIHNKIVTDVNVFSQLLPYCYVAGGVTRLRREASETPIFEFLKRRNPNEELDKIIESIFMYITSYLD